METAIFKKAFKDTLPIMAGYVILGMGFGVIMNSYGYGIGFVAAMSLFIYAGSMQYTALGLFTGGVSMITVALTTLAVNARHLFYGISMVDKYKNSGPAKPYLIFSLTDETFSLVCNQTIGDNHLYYLLVSVFDHMYWILGSIIGALLGSALSFNSDGVDFALTALFITVFVDQWLHTKSHFAALLGVIASVICLIIFGSADFLIPTMIVIFIILFLKMKFERGEVASE